MLSFLIIGLIVGVALALTGGGGAIIGIPLMVHLGGMSIVTASVLALPIVAVSAAISVFIQRTEIQWRSLMWILLAAIPATFFFAMIKPLVPMVAIQMLLVAIALWGLVTVWRVRVSLPIECNAHPIAPLLIGTVSGAMTSITGLGGGLLLFPMLRRFLGLSDSGATATSLAIIVINAIISFGIQSRVISLGGVGRWSIVALVLGFILANAIVHLIMVTCSKQCHQRVVKVIYTMVLGVSIILLLGAPS